MFSHLLPEGCFLLENSSSLLLPLPGEEVPPGVESLVVEEEEGTASQVAGADSQDGQSSS